MLINGFCPSNGFIFVNQLIVSVLLMAYGMTDPHGKQGIHPFNIHWYFF